MNSKSEPDSIDWKILELLQGNARLSSSEIGKRVGLSQPAVTGRIRRLEAAGVIEGYTARVNGSRLGREPGAFIRLKTTHQHLGACLKAFERIPEILEVHRVTGEDSFLIKACFERMTRLQDTIDSLGRFGSITTCLILATYTPKPLARDRG